MRSIILALSLLGVMACQPLWAVVDNDASVVQLRTSCVEAGSNLDNCFTNLDVLNAWIQGTRTPEASDPLAVKIGVGVFPGVIDCKGDQHISLIGSGRSNTVLKRSGINMGLLVVMMLKDNCNINVQDLRIDNIGGLAAIQVNDNASSTFNILSVWNNVEIIATGYTWVEEHCDPAVTGSKHFWTGSKLTSFVSNSAIAPFAKAYVSCAENWFHATEITALAEEQPGVPQVTALLSIGETHVYGGVIRAITGSGVTLPDPAPYTGGAGPQGLVGVYALGPKADVHVHGTGIDVISNENNNVAGILTENNTNVHIQESSFNMSSGCSGGQCGGIWRIVDTDSTSNIKSTFKWENATEPPLLSSQNGADTFVETDCPSTGNCSAGGTFPHTMIYRAECTGTEPNEGPWYDTVTNACRQ